MPIRGSPNGVPLTLIHTPDRWTPSLGIGGRHRAEWVDAINRYGWTSSIGIGGRHHSVRPVWQYEKRCYPLLRHLREGTVELIGLMRVE